MATRKPKAASADKGDEVAELVVLPATAPKGTDLMTDVQSTLDGLMVATIDSPIMFELAGAELQELQAKYKDLEDKRFAITRPMDAAKKAVMELFKPALTLLDGQIGALKGSMLTYTREEQRKAAVKQALLDKIAADQRAALAAEQARQAEEVNKQTALAAQLMEAGGDSAAIAEALDKAEQSQEMVAALGQTVEVVSAATAATNVPTVEGVTTADVWKARVTDLPALLRYIADHPDCLDWVEIKMTGLNDLAKAQRDALRIPGVEAFEEARISARSLKAAA